MKHSKHLLAAGVILSAACSAGTAQTIVNIPGYGDDGAGAEIFAYPVAPGTAVSLFNPVLLTLAAGDYALSSAWGLAGALYDTWNFQTSVPGSWASHFVAAEVVGEGKYKLLLDGVSLLEPTCKNHFCAWDTRAEATAAFLATPAFQLHLDHDAQIAFASADYYLPDNLGGISLKVVPTGAVPAVPEPQTTALLLAGLGAVGWAGWRRRRPA